jgi:hypothetical protein
MNFNIEPYIGVGPLKFGMTPTETRIALGQSAQPFLKSQEDVLPSDAFDTLGIHVHYKSPGVCVAIEFGLAADPMFRGRHLIERPFDELLVWFQTIDENVHADESGLTSFGFGVGLYAPNATERPKDAVEGVIVFARGYYD